MTSAEQPAAAKVRCTRCLGRGWRNEDESYCQACDGEGEVAPCAACGGERSRWDLADGLTACWSCTCRESLAVTAEMPACTMQELVFGRREAA